jgi:tetratricopeptide (TPR) repeat protein
MNTQCYTQLYPSEGFRLSHRDVNHPSESLRSGKSGVDHPSESLRSNKIRSEIEYSYKKNKSVLNCLVILIFLIFAIPAGAQDYCTTAQQAFDAGKYEEAIKYFRACKEVSGRNTDSEIGKCEAKIEEKKASEKAARQKAEKERREREFREEEVRLQQNRADAARKAEQVATLKKQQEELDRQKAEQQKMEAQRLADEKETIRLNEEGKTKLAQKNYREALTLFRRSVDRGSVIAENNIGYMYELGLGVARDPQTAARHYYTSARAGFALAQFNLARLYEQGNGVKKDRKLAVSYYRMAAEQGLPEATERLKDITK